MTHMTTSIVTPMPMSAPAHAGKRARGGGPRNRRPSDSWHAADRSVVSKKTLLQRGSIYFDLILCEEAYRYSCEAAFVCEFC